jgi:hypothetical protein
MNRKAPINLLNGDHILGALIGGAISLPSTAWLFYAVIHLLSVDIMNQPFPMVITGITGFICCYLLVGFFVSWLIGGCKDML